LRSFSRAFVIFGATLPRNWWPPKRLPTMISRRKTTNSNHGGALPFWRQGSRVTLGKPPRRGLGKRLLKEASRRTIAVTAEDDKDKPQPSWWNPTSWSSVIRRSQPASDLPPPALPPLQQSVWVTDQAWEPPRRRNNVLYESSNFVPPPPEPPPPRPAIGWSRSYLCQVSRDNE
jgi:hypothetical protein